MAIILRRVFRVHFSITRLRFWFVSWSVKEVTNFISTYIHISWNFLQIASSKPSKSATILGRNRNLYLLTLQCFRTRHFILLCSMPSYITTHSVIITYLEYVCIYCPLSILYLFLNCNIEGISWRHGSVVWCPMIGVSSYLFSIISLLKTTWDICRSLCTSS